MSRHSIFTKLFMFSLIFTIALIFIQPAAAEDETITMFIATGGTRTDGAWGQSMFKAYEFLKAKYPNDKITFSDLVPYEDTGPMLEAQAEMGIDLIYVDGSFFEATETVSARFPKTWFVLTNLTDDELSIFGDNVASYGSRDEEGGYLAGVAAGMMTKTNTIGYVAGLDYPDIIRAGKGLELGAKLVNPDVKLLVFYIGNWDDVEKGYQGAKTIIEAGADIIMQYADNAGKGVFKAAKDHKVYMIGEALDQVDFAPDLVITSFLVDHAKLAEQALLDLKAGRMKHQVREFGIKDGWPVIAPIRNVPPEVEAKVMEVLESIKKGEIKVPTITDPKALRTLE